MIPLRGVVVGGVNVGETHRIVRLLTAEEGRVALFARGARASKRRWAGLLEPGTVLHVERARGRGSLAALASADPIHLPRHARAELERIALLAYSCELCAALAPEGEAAVKLERLLEVCLLVLEGEPTPGVRTRLALEAKALTFAGIAPALVRCATCGAALDDDGGLARFDAESGGAIHPRCGSGQHVSVADLAVLEELRRTPLAASAGDPAGHATPWLLANFARHQLARELNSVSLLRDLMPG